MNDHAPPQLTLSELEFHVTGRRRTSSRLHVADLENTLDGLTASVENLLKEKAAA